jgi:hypothetical protein
MKSATFPFYSHRSQAGATSLVLVSLMLLLIGMGLGFTHQNLAFEQKSSASQVQAAIAFESAETAVAWAQTWLNDPRALNAACEPEPQHTDEAQNEQLSFRNRMLRYHEATRQWQALPVQARCIRQSGQWRCQCDLTSDPSAVAGPPNPAQIDPAPSFLLHFESGPVPGAVRVKATGCSQTAHPCVTESLLQSEGQAQVDVVLTLVGGLRSPPGSALTVQGALQASRISVIHGDPQTQGWAMIVGGLAEVGGSWFSNASGGMGSQVWLDHVAALHNHEPLRLFSRYSGVQLNGWGTRLAQSNLHCIEDCTQALAQAAGPYAAPQHQMIYLSHDASVSGPLEIGSPQAPVILAVQGRLKLVGSVKVHGFIYAQSLRWESALAPDAWVRGAVVVSGPAHLEGEAQFLYDPQVMQQLRWQTGAFVLLPGSWKDYPLNEAQQ